MDKNQMSDFLRAKSSAHWIKGESFFVIDQLPFRFPDVLRLNS